MKASGQMYRKSILFQDAKESENGMNGREENRGSSTVFPGIVSSAENEGNSGRVEDSDSTDTPIMLSSGLRETNQTYPGSERNISGSNMGINNMSNGNGRNNAGENEKSGSKSNSGATPVIPLPNPGEGGPVYPGNNTGGSGNGNTGNGSNMGGNNSNGNTGSGSNSGAIPVIPLPNPGEGGPVYPGNNTGGNNGNSNSQGGLNIPAIIGTIITTFPRPGEPCKFCANSSQTTGKVRFLNAASNYNPFRVYINDQLFVQTLNFAEVTAYEKVPNGYQIVTIMGDNNYIYIQKPVMVPRAGAVTIAICNTQTGLDLFVISDTACSRSNYLSCLRVCNLSLDSGALSVVVGNNDVSFMNVSFQEITGYKILTPENYLFYVLNGRRRIILTSILSVKRNASYTMYLINWNVTSPDTVTVIMVEEHNG